jgi:transposase-like protein
MTILSFLFNHKQTPLNDIYTVHLLVPDTFRYQCLVLKQLYKKRAIKSRKDMSRERRFYTEEFKEKVLCAYNSSDESASEIARRFQINHDTVKSWVYRKRTVASYDSAKSVKFAESETNWMEKDKKLSPEAMEARIRELEQQLSVEKMRSESMCRMPEIAGREFKIDIRKKSGAKQSLG